MLLVKVSKRGTDLHHLLIRWYAYLLDVFLDLPDLIPCAHVAGDLGEVGRDIGRDCGSQESLFRKLSERQV